MDINRQQPKTKNKQKKYLLSAVIALLAGTAWLLQQPAAASKVDRQDIWTATVQQGELALTVDGFGKLKSKVQRLLTAPANALVEEVLLRPGALVNKNSVILRLSNPEMEQEVRDAQRELENRKAQHRQLGLSQQRELLSQQATLTDLDSELELATVKVEAEAQLHKEGIVSTLDFKRSTAELKRFEKRLNIEQQRLKQLQQSHQESLIISQQRIDQQQEQLSVIGNRFERLTVRAGMEGVLQQLPVELGQNVAIGEQVALVGSMKSLKAELQVSQSQVQQLAIGQQVDIDTRGGEVQGIISRIDPVIQQGSVYIDVDLTGELPNNARPELSIDGLVHTGFIENTLYLKKPVGALPNSSIKLFRLTENDQAEVVNISLGVESDEFMQIKTGASVGESYILSDMSRWQQHNKIAIKD